MGYVLHTGVQSLLQSKETKHARTERNCLFSSSQLKNFIVHFKIVVKNGKYLETHFTSNDKSHSKTQSAVPFSVCFKVVSKCLGKPICSLLVSSIVLILDFSLLPHVSGPAVGVSVHIKMVFKWLGRPIYAHLVSWKFLQ